MAWPPWQSRSRKRAPAVARQLGINDAPALAQADAGMPWVPEPASPWKAPAGTLVKGDLRGIARANNALGIAVAAGVLYPAFGLLLSPVFARAAMALSPVSVVMNALRLRRAKLQRVPGTIYA